ncbi:DUF6118 family protein [Croceicoccus naphthovorans]|uniref:Uncharacterized protein n=1 Tax=Croceicoccus naphthovorans TaxID=1348774 RepID=A0A0G3XJ21_9SPHN|nr:DUF6118 family protein [Croceicoccus naphthovorans]AKM10611.1 hypothetical protein AB433_12610 [Croceicoccus naphthovorans]MBB3988836.1 hypothetical protein [Croceicoccus naphthovorans]
MEDDHIEEVQLDLEVVAPTAPEPKPETGAAEESDPATEAFARLEGEMAMVRHTVQNMARERADIVIPDYTATLGQMADQITQVSKMLTAIGNKPAIEMTPEDIAVQIKRASLDLLRDSSDLFRHGRKDLDLATGRLAAIVGRVRTEDEQKRQALRFAGMGLAAGILLWSILPGTIARAMPESWQWPERMARKAVGEPTIVEAGIRLIRSQNPEAWEELAAAQRILSENHEALDRCRERASEASTAVSCTVQIEPSRPSSLQKEE